MLDFLPVKEKIILIARRHWIVVAPQAIALPLLAVAPIILPRLVAAVFPNFGDFISQTAASPVSQFLLLSWIFLLWVFFFITWTSYYLNMMVLTEGHVIDIEQKGLFKRDVVTLALKNIQDIKVETIGLLPAIFNFGNLEIETAGAVREAVLKNLRNPNGVKESVLRSIESAKASFTQNTPSV